MSFAAMWFVIPLFMN